VAKNYIKLIYSIEESASMALCEVLGEARGKVAGLKALGNGKIEVSLQGKGQLSGSDMDDVVTLWSEGIAVHMSTADMAEWRGSGKALRTHEGRRQER
jgi:hypothetical protein